MTAFEILCESCGCAQEGEVGRACRACRKERFSLRVRRSSLGFDSSSALVGWLVSWADLGTAVGALLNPELEVGSLSACEVGDFVSSSNLARRRLFAEWKRRESINYNS